MSADAIAVLHPRDPEKLKPFLDLDEESEESDGLYAEALDDGSFLVHTFQPFEVFVENPSEARVWLGECFGETFDDVHDDPRGVLFFPDDEEPSARTYDAVVAELADKGMFITRLDDDEEDDPAADLAALKKLEQLLGVTPGEPSSFAVGKLFTDMQQQIVEALGGADALRPAESPVLDHEFEPEESDPKKK